MRFKKVKQYIQKNQKSLPTEFQIFVICLWLPTPEIPKMTSNIRRKINISAIRSKE